MHTTTVCNNLDADVSSDRVINGIRGKARSKPVSRQLEMDLISQYTQ
jgi:hypothetical protein